MILKKLNEDHYAFLCPGCNDIHVVGPECVFNGNYERPTFTPSFYDWDSHGVCHLHITKGKLMYLPDSTHFLSEQTVPMPPVPAWLANDDPDEEVPAEDTDISGGYIFTSAEYKSTEEPDVPRTLIETFYDSIYQPGWDKE